MTTPRFAGAALLTLTLLFSASGQERLRSSLQVGEEIPSSFYPLNVNGPDAGQKRCLV